MKTILLEEINRNRTLMGLSVLNEVAGGVPTFADELLKLLKPISTSGDEVIKALLTVETSLDDFKKAYKTLSTKNANKAARMQAAEEIMTKMKPVELANLIEQSKKLQGFFSGWDTVYAALQKRGPISADLFKKTLDDYTEKAFQGTGIPNDVQSILKGKLKNVGGGTIVKATEQLAQETLNLIKKSSELEAIFDKPFLGKQTPLQKVEIENITKQVETLIKNKSQQEIVAEIKALKTQIANDIKLSKMTSQQKTLLEKAMTVKFWKIAGVGLIVVYVIYLMIKNLVKTGNPVTGAGDTGYEILQDIKNMKIVKKIQKKLNEPENSQSAPTNTTTIPTNTTTTPTNTVSIPPFDPNDYQKPNPTNP